MGFCQTYFTYFSNLTALYRTPNTPMNKNGEGRHTFLSPDLKGKVFNILPVSTMLAMVVS